MFSAAKTAGPSGYNINNSLRFRSSASAYLSRTPGSAGNRRTWTLSMWFKLGALPTADNNLYRSSSDAGANQIWVYFNSSNSNALNFGIRISSTNYQLQIAPIHRDPSAWYHLVYAVDTTQATSSNRAKIYINGEQVTNFISSSYPPQNSDTSTNNTGGHALGSLVGGGGYFDGYMTEINFIDGQALTPASFGSTNATTGVWQPAKYTGSYGTNGFYLPFSDIGLTSGSNTGLGKDFSGNSNYWTTNNISVTAGTTYDAMTDSPTLTSATVANYAVMSPIDFITANGTISSANLNWASSTNVCGNRATIGSTSGKWYWEAIGSSVTSGTIGGRFAFTGSDTSAVEQDKFGMYWHPTSGIARIVNGTNTYVTSAYTYTNSDVLALALDLDNNISYWYKNGVLQYTYDFSSFSTIGSRVFFPYVWNASSGTPSWVYNFGQRPFSYTPPSGFKALNTFNLPDSTIKKGNSYMDATLWTGDGTSSRSITNAALFRPDFVWIKNRSRDGADPYYGVHMLFNTVTGAGNRLMSQSTTSEIYSASSLTAFNSNGFSVGSDLPVNRSGDSFVGWQWQAGQGSTSSNTSGSITSTVSVNTTAGFSVVTWTSDGFAGVKTMGHGLGVAPKFIIAKDRTTTSLWWVYHTSLASDNKYLQLQSTAAVTDASPTQIWSTSSTTFGIRQSALANNGDACVAYCWAEIEGFSKFGSYIGNYNVNGTFVYCGFRPSWILIKCVTQVYEWELIDVRRTPYNGASNYLQPNLSNAEYSTTVDILDIVSNGFKLRTNWTRVNDSSPTPFIYAAFAENPFKNALAR